jgi:CBS domain-containing protein
MLVKNRMTAEVITLTPEQTLLKAMTLMQQKGIRRLPVVQGNRSRMKIGSLDFGRYSRVKPSCPARGVTPRYGQLR